MRSPKLVSLLISGVLAAGSLISAVQAAPTVDCFRPDRDRGGVRNIIVMISDGCGYGQIEATDYYQYGRLGRQVYERFPVKLGMSTYSYYGSYDPIAAWSDFNWVKSGATDSASAATAMSTGMKTYDAAIGVDINRQPLVHLMQQAEALGKRTGVVSSVPFSHATPAGYVAHNTSRNDYKGIANEMLRVSATDVILSAGHPFFDDSHNVLPMPKFGYIGEADFDYVASGQPCADADGNGTPDPWTFVDSQAEFRSLLLDRRVPERVFGLAECGSTLQQSRAGDGQAAPFTVPFNKGVPNLSELSVGALRVLDQGRKGFVLMIEGGAVDWAGHANQLGRTIEEEIDFNQAVEAVCAWVQKNSNWGETLLVVTGDHECGYLTGAGSNPLWQPIVNNGKGQLPGAAFYSGSHTNALIPFFAMGKGHQLFRFEADQVDPVRGAYLDNTELAKVCFDVLD